MLRESACLCEVPRVGKVAEEKVGERLPGLEGVDGQVGLFLMGAELQPGMIESSESDGGVGCAA